MKKISLPYITWRDGRPRFTPSQRERGMGFHPEDLKAAGRWMTFEEAKAWAVARAKEITARRKSGRAVPRAKAGRTVADLLDDWLNDVKMRYERGEKYTPSTFNFYRNQVAAICFKPQERYSAEPRVPELFGKMAVSAVGVPELKQFIDYQTRVRGRHMARASRAVLQTAFQFGRESTKWRLGANPAAGLKFKQAPPRIVVFSPQEIGSLVDTADRMGRASIGDAIMLGVFTGQRQGDRLGLVDLGLVDGRRQFRQNKTGVVVGIRQMPDLASRLEQARLRVAALHLAKGWALGDRPQEVIIDETTGRRYNPHTYRHVFDKVRREAGKLLPSLLDKREQDLRDTAITWLARAGATLPMIAAISGHSLQSITSVMKHYLAVTPDQGDAGIGMLIDWWKEQGFQL